MFDSSEIIIEQNVIYGTAAHFHNWNDVTMLLDVYRPDASIDSTEQRPMILLIEGGSFKTENKEVIFTTAWNMLETAIWDMVNNAGAGGIDQGVILNYSN